MKRQLRFVALAAVMLLAGGTVEAQNIALVGKKFTVNTPTSISGSKTISFPTDWGGQVTSPLYQIPVVRAIDSLACGTLTNGTGSVPALTGRFALIFRGDCEFGAKAMQAQSKGAIGVIIVNNIPGAPVGMGAGAQGAGVTIPVLMISQADGLAMNSQIRAGANVTVSLTNWGFGFAHDLGFIPGGTALPPFSAMPLNQLTTNNGNPAAYNVYNGSLFANFGTSNESNVKVKSTVTFVPTTGASTVVFSDSATLATFNAIDSVQEITSAGIYSPKTTVKGRFDIKYTVSAAAADLDTSDNSATVSMTVTDSIYSKGRYDFTANRPLAPIAYRSNSGAQVWGQLIYVARGGQFPKKLQFTVSNSANPALFNQPPVIGYVFKWVDGNGAGAANRFIEGSELTLLYDGGYTYGTNDSSFGNFTMDLAPYNSTTATAFTDNSYYWVALEPLDPTMYLGADDGLNFYMRSYTAKHGPTTSILDFWAPQYRGSWNTLNPPTTTLDMIPFYSGVQDIDSVGFAALKGLIPAIALHVTSTSPTPPPNSVAGLASNFADVKLFPNPATDHVTVQYSLKDAGNDMYYNVMNSVGVSVGRGKVAAGRTGSIQVSTANLANGTYYLSMGNDKGTTVRQFVVTK